MARITKIGNSHGVALSKEELAKSGLVPGDEVTTLPVQDGVLVVAANSQRGKMFQAALSDMDARPDVYRKLAE
jgi:putative addiction module antidote